MADSVPQVDIEATVHTAGSVSVGGSVTGEITQLGGGRRDHDWFAVTLEAGKTYRIEVRGSETGDGTLADPVLEGVYDASGRLVGGTGDDDGGTGKNSLKVFTPDADGTYYVAAGAYRAATGTYTVAVEEIAIPEDDFSASTGTAGTVAVGGSATGEITLTAGPRDHDWFAVSLEAGKTYRIDVKGADTGDGTLADPVLVGMYDATGTFVGGGDDNGGVGRNSLKSFAPETTGTYHVAARGYSDGTGTYTVAVEEVSDDFSASTGTAGAVAVGGSATGEITLTAGSRDHDWFAVSLEAGKSYRIEVRGSVTGDGTLADPILVGMYDATGTLVGGTGDDNGGVGRNSLKVFTPETTGTYHVAARAHGTATGTYTVAVEEIAIPEDDFSASTGTAGVVAVGGSATGEITLTAGPLDHDWFAVSLEAGKTYRIDVKGRHTWDGTLFDPVLVGMYDATGTFVGGGDDDGGVGYNSLKVFTPATTGTYHVAVRTQGTATGTYTVAVEEIPQDDFSASTGTAGAVAVGGSATGEITLTVGPRDHDWFAVSLEAGKSYRIEVRGSETGDGTLADPILVGMYDATGTFIGGGDDNGGAGRNSLTVFAPETTGTYYVAARAHGANTGTYTVAVEEVSDDFSASTGTAGAVAVGGSATGEITPTVGPRDHDWFAVSLEAGKSYRIDVRGSETGDGTLADPALVGMYDATGTFVGGGDDNGGAGLNSLKVFTPETTGTYYVAARAHGANTGTYTVAVEEIALPGDDFSASTGTAGAVAVGGSATGEITRIAGLRDHDWFAVSLEAGKTYRIDVKGAETGDGTLADPILVGMYDAAGTFVGGGDDNGGAGRNSLKFFAPETTGTYHVAARAHGGNTGTYTVAVEEVSQDDFSASTGTAGTVAVGGSATGEINRIAGLRDHDWFAVSLEAGKTYRIEVRGSETGDGTLADPILVGMYDATGTFIGGGDDNGGAGLNSLRVFAPETTGTYHVAARAHGVNTGTYTVAVEEVSDDFSASTGTAGAVAVGGSATGEITPTAGPRDHDWFAVSLVAGKSYRIEVRGSETGDGTLADPILVGMYDATGTFIGGGDDNGGAGRNSLKSFAPETTGTYHVAARAHGANTGTYTVAVNEVEDDYAASATLAMVEMGEVRVVEGGMAVFTIRLSHAATGEVTVEWSVGGTVTAGDDYTGAAGPFVLTFAAGETEKTVEIQTLDDTASEGDETLTVTLSDPSGATLGSVVSASVTITDDDPVGQDVDPVGQQQPLNLPTADDDAPPEVSVADVTVTEGGTARLTLSLSRASSSEVAVHWSSADGTAGSGDYTGSATAQRVVFAAGETSKVIDVATVQDGVHEGAESFTVTLSDPQGATLGSKSSAAVAITDDDAPPEVPVAVETPAIGLELKGTQGSNTLTGGERNDRIDGLGGNDVLYGGGGDDLLIGGAGRDKLRGGTGDDLLFGGPGGDLFHGGSGADVFRIEPAHDGRVRLDEIEDFEVGIDKIDLRGTGLTFGDLNVVNIGVVSMVSHSTFVLYLREMQGTRIGADDFLFGELRGTDGAEALVGGSGADRIEGLAGDDLLSGGGGDDVLVGGGGDDRLYGDGGADSFVYSAEAFGRDRIVDFEDGTDVLEFHRLQWSDLSVRNNADGDAVIQVTGTNDAVVLEGVDAALVGQDDFLFF